MKYSHHVPSSLQWIFLHNIGCSFLLMVVFIICEYMSVLCPAHNYQVYEREFIIVPPLGKVSSQKVYTPEVRRQLDSSSGAGHLGVRL